MAESFNVRMSEICLRLKILADEISLLTEAEDRRDQLAVVTGKASAIVEDLELEWVAARDDQRRSSSPR